MNGKGLNKYKDGSTYEGNYKNGLKHGLEKYTWLNEIVFYGSWLNNKLHGNGYYLLDKEKFNITFRFGKIISTRKDEELDENQRIKLGYDNIVNKNNLEDADNIYAQYAIVFYTNQINVLDALKIIVLIV